MSEILHIGEGKNEYQMSEKEKQDHLHAFYDLTHTNLRDFFCQKFFWIHLLEGTNLSAENIPLYFGTNLFMTSENIFSTLVT